LHVYSSLLHVYIYTYTYIYIYIYICASMRACVCVCMCIHNNCCLLHVYWFLLHVYQCLLHIYRCSLHMFRCLLHDYRSILHVYPSLLTSFLKYVRVRTVSPTAVLVSTADWCTARTRYRGAARRSLPLLALRSRVSLVAVCCSLGQCVAVSGSVLQCGVFAMCLQCAVRTRYRGAACRSLPLLALQSRVSLVAVCCSVWHCVAVRVAVSCSVLQCAAVCLQCGSFVAS